MSDPTRRPARLVAAYAGPARSLAAYLATLAAVAASTTARQGEDAR